MDVQSWTGRDLWMAQYNVTLYWMPATYNVMLYSRKHGYRVGLYSMTEKTKDELPADWWTTDDVLTYLESVGAPIGRATWGSYVSRGQAPSPDRLFGRSPVWRPDAVRQWQAARPRKGSRDA